MKALLTVIEESLKTNDLDTAKEAVKSIGDDPGTVSRAYQLLGDLFRRHKLFEEAHDSYKESITASKGNNTASAYGQLECLKTLNRVEDFKKAAVRFRDNDRLNENIISRTALAAAEIGDTDSASFLIKRFETDYGESNEPRSWFRISKACLLLGNREQSLKHAIQAKHYAEGNIDLLLEIATIDYDLDKYWEMRYNSSQGERTPVPVHCQSDDGYSERAARDSAFLTDSFHSLFGDTTFPVGADCGCGSGRLTSLLSKRCALLDCYDVSKTAVEYAKSNNTDLKNITYTAQNLSKTPLPKEKYDFVFDFTAVQHVSDPVLWGNVLSNYVTACKKGGIIFLVETIGDIGRRDVLHVSDATPQDYIDHMLSEGTRLIHQQTTPWGEEACLVFRKSGTITNWFDRLKRLCTKVFRGFQA